MLRVDVYQACRQRLEFCQRYHRVIHKRTRFAVAVQFAANDTLVKLRLDDTLVFAVGNGFGVCSSAHYQIERTENNTLTCTRFAGQHGETALKVKV